MGSSDQTVQQVQDPWGPTQSYLQGLLPSANSLYENGSFAPPTYQQAMGRSTLADQSWATGRAQDGIREQALQGMNGTTSLDVADGAISNIAGGGLNDAQAGSMAAYASAMNAGPSSAAFAGPQYAGPSTATNAAMQGLSGSLAGQFSNTGPNREQRQGYGMINAAGNAGPVTNQADLEAGLEAAKQDALGTAIPAAVAQFAGSGMANSSQAMQEVSRAATQAVAPIDYAYQQAAVDRDIAAQESDLARQMSAGSALGSFGGANADRSVAAQESGLARQLSAAGMAAGIGSNQESMLQSAMENDVNRQFSAQESDMARMLSGAGGLSTLGGQVSGDQLRAAALAPTSYQSTYMPEQMLSSLGASLDTRAQQERDTNVANYYERVNRPVDNLGGYAGLLTGVSGLGGTSSTTQPGASTASQVAGAGLGALGTYGALAATPAAPFALPAAGLAGILGLF